MTTMRAWQAVAHGALEDVLRLAELPIPVPGHGEVRIRVEAAGINFADTLAVAGTYQVRSEPPFTPGSEFAGSIDAVGPGVDLAVGTPVVAYAVTGAFAEFAIAPAAQVFIRPDAYPADAAAAMLITWQTSWFALGPRARLQAGETLLVHAGTSGVGLAAIQLGRRIGARVIATAGGPDKTAHLRTLGVDLAVDYTGEDFVAATMAFTDGRGADVIYDPVGGDVADRSLRCIAWNGRHVVIGFASGVIPAFAGNRIMLKNISVVGLHWPPCLEREPELVRTGQAAITRAYLAGEADPDIGERYGLVDLPKALTALRDRRARGKLIVLPNR
jgi:NADPH2:quinone reductase